MKIVRVRVSGFRSFRNPQTIELQKGRSLCLFAENGRGKSSFTDALEYWSTGDVPWARRDGVGLAALVHIDADDASVEVTTDAGVASRSLRGSRPDPLRAGQGPMAVGFAPEPIPILRNRTMAAFVDKTANDKRTELLTMLGLVGLVPFRLGLRSAARRARADAKDARGTAAAAEDAWSEALGGRDVVGRLRDLCSRAQLGDVISTEDGLMQYSAPPSATVPASTRLAQADELAQANDALGAAGVESWNAAVANRAVAVERGVSALLDVGQSVLEEWSDESCPLCLKEQPREALLDRVRERAAALAAADAQFATAARALEEREQAVARLGRALRAVVDDERNRDWSHLSEAGACLRVLRDELKAVREARRNREVLRTQPPTLPSEAIRTLREAALKAPGDTAPALLELAQLRARLQARREGAAEAVRCETIARSAERAAEIGDVAVREAIGAALADLNDELGQYYGKLVGTTPYTNVRLEYQTSRAGGVEFAFVWDGREPVCPPQRVMSESQLGALGLSLFLARLKVRPPEWRTMVLDDVVTSFDVVHRTRLVRLLVEDFEDWQVLLCTHDPQLSRTVQDEAPKWLSLKVTGWSPTSGPVFGQAESRARLRERLQRGDAADELGGLARQAMEQALERPIRQLGLRIRHDPANRYSADDYRRALITGLRGGNYPHADHAVLKRLATDGSVTNRACHFKDQEPGVTAADLEVLLDDLDALDAIFHCDGCKKPAWAVQTRNGHCQCQCGALSCA